MGHKIDTELSDAEYEVLQEAMRDVKRSIGAVQGMVRLSEPKSRLAHFRIVTLNTITDKLGL